MPPSARADLPEQLEAEDAVTVAILEDQVQAASLHHVHARKLEVEQLELLQSLVAVLSTGRPGTTPPKVCVPVDRHVPVAPLDTQLPLGGLGHDVQRNQGLGRRPYVGHRSLQVGSAPADVNGPGAAVRCSWRRGRWNDQDTADIVARPRPAGGAGGEDLDFALLFDDFRTLHPLANDRSSRARPPHDEPRLTGPCSMFFWDVDDNEEAGTARPIGLRGMAARMGPLMRPHRGRLGLAAALLLVATAGDVAGPLVLRYLIDVAIPSGSVKALAGGAVLFLALFLIAKGATYKTIVVVTRAGLRIVAGLKRRLFDHVLGLSMGYFDQNPPGRLLARVESDTERLLALFSQVALALIGSLVILVATLCVMFATDWRITLAVLCILLPLAVLNVLFVRYLRPFFGRARTAYAGLSSFLTDHIQAVPVVQAYSLEAHASTEMERWNRERIRTEMAADMRAYPYWGLIAAVEVVVVMLVLYVGSQQVFGEAMGIGTLVLFIEYSRRLFEPILAFSEQLGFVQRAFASADRVFDVLETPSQTPERPGASDRSPRDFRELRFEDVRFSYDDGPPAVDGVSFSIRRGEHVALVGRTGGGKSTIAKLLMRFYESQEGRITVDGMDVRDFTHEAWRRVIGLVPQDIHLFPGSIRENLTVLEGKETDERLVRALEVVQATDLVARRKKGLDAPLGESGQTLSQGERQLLCFARAVVRDPPLLLLDEATSSVDPGTERRLQAAVQRLLAGRTALTIAHRLSTVVSADRILVVHGGRIVAEGRHEELIETSRLYSELCRLQLREDPRAGGSSNERALRTGESS